jgi:hypothetical protein
MSKPLKEQNHLSIWLIVAANALILYMAITADSLRLAGLGAVVKEFENLLPVGLAVVITSVLNGLLSNDMKANLVFWRWRNVLPGHRAFTHYAKSDARIDVASLERALGSVLPTDPPEQNRFWYRLYKTVQEKPAVTQVHRQFLLLRDYTGLAFLFFVFFGAAGMYAIPSWKTSVTYLGVLLVQYLLARKAAANYGARMVCTVLAEVAATPPASSPGPSTV